jgi:glyoxylase-like metal-dependent hydrolase (beta-lactamase superfamily II)
LGDLLIFKFPSNHTNDNLVVLDKKSKILFLGDALCGEIIDYDFVKDDEIITMQKTVLSNLDFEYALESHSNIKTKEELLTKLRNEWRD